MTMKQGSVALYVLALIGFFLPWSNVTCEVSGGTTSAFQSGFQMVTSGHSRSESGDPGVTLKHSYIAKNIRAAYLPVGFAILLIAGLILLSKSHPAAAYCGFGAGAFALIQVVIGFPLAVLLLEEHGTGAVEKITHHIVNGFWISIAGAIGGAILIIVANNQKAAAGSRGDAMLSNATNSSGFLDSTKESRLNLGESADADVAAEPDYVAPFTYIETHTRLVPEDDTEQLIAHK